MRFEMAWHGRVLPRDFRGIPRRSSYGGLALPGPRRGLPLVLQLAGLPHASAARDPALVDLCPLHRFLGASPRC